GPDLVQDATNARFHDARLLPFDRGSELLRTLRPIRPLDIPEKLRTRRFARASFVCGPRPSGTIDDRPSIV
ncbi:MAG: hypothetical protein ACLP7Q_00135, partial [Isosphaeraceae bacterium]